MDAVIFIFIALVMVIIKSNKPERPTSTTEVIPEDVTREAKLNDSFYEDPNAFSEIINALGYPREEI